MSKLYTIISHSLDSKDCPFTVTLRDIWAETKWHWTLPSQGVGLGVEVIPKGVKRGCFLSLSEAFSEKEADLALEIKEAEKKLVSLKKMSRALQKWKSHLLSKSDG